MQAYDIFMLALMIAAAVWGARRGLAKQLATLASLILGYTVAINFRQPVAELIDVAPPWNIFAAMLVLFMGTSLAIWLGFQFVSSSIQKMGLDAFDTQMGALFGLVKGGLLAMVITMFAVVMLGDRQRDAVLDSFSGYHMCLLINRTHSIVPSEWQQAMTPYLETLEEHPQFADHIPAGGAVDSPSDLGTNLVPSAPYEDPTFGNHTQLPPSPLAPTPFQANRSDDPRRQAAEAQAESAQAILLEPNLDQRR